MNDYDLTNKAEKEQFFIDMVERMERHKAFHEYKTDKEAWESLLEVWTRNQQEALIDDMDTMVDMYAERIAWVTNYLAQM